MSKKRLVVKDCNGHAPFFLMVTPSGIIRTYAPHAGRWIMASIVRVSIILLTVAACRAFGTPTIASGDVLAPMTVEEAKNQLLSWAASQPTMSDALRSELLALWEAESTTEEPDRLLTLVVRSFAAVDAEAKALLAACNSTPRETHLPNGRFLKQPARDPFYTANLGLFYGRFLVEQRMFDEALEQLNEVPEQRVVDLASLFFFKAVAAQGALQAGPALEAIDRLLNHVERVPVRYLVTATLMQADLQTREEKSLGEIGRLMSDSERRLDLGRAGEKVQGVQERIVFELDEIIKKLEQQQGGGEGNASECKDTPSTNPSDDSRVKGSEAPGEVDPKKFSKDRQWGNIPNKDDQTRAKNNLNRNFPSHYGRAIDQYFRKQSERAAKNTP